MKPKNFPLKKLIRQAKATGRQLTEQEKNNARSIRTKKSREVKK